MPTRRYRKRRSKGSSLSKGQRKEMQKIAQKTIDRIVEDKSYVHTEENQQLYHNKPFYVDNFLGDIGQGVQTGDQNDTGGSGIRAVRIGDEIMLKNFSIKLWLSNKLDRPNVLYRVALYWYETTQSPDDELIYSTQSTKALDRYNLKSIKLIRTFTLQSTDNYAQPYYLPVTIGGESVAVTGKEKSYLKTMNKRWNRGKKITYDDNGLVPKGWNIGMSVVAYDAYGTEETDNIASFAYNSLITFQDA